MTSLRCFVVLCLLFVLAVSAQSPRVAGAGGASAAQDTRIRSIEANAVDISLGKDEAPLRLDLAKLMQVYKVPGLSVAVIDNFEVVWAKGYGVMDPGPGKAVTPGTLFQAGSISKPVAAAGALALV